MKTISFKTTIGIVEGYNSSAKLTENAAQKKVAMVWQEVATEHFKKNGIYVSANVSPSLTVYNQEWGCPNGGEVTAIVTGEANPAFTDDMDLWKKSVIEIVKEVKNRLHQSTVVLTFQEIESFYYLQND